MTLEATAFGDVPLRRMAEGYEIQVRLPSYRSLPLSCIEDIGVTLAGQKPPRDQLRVLRDGRQFTIDELADMADEEWFVRDALTIVAPRVEAAAESREIDLEVELAMRVPYIILGPKLAMIQKTHLKRKVAVQ